ncbi:hypothetical protein GGI11_001173 [Coemansia sp. RSA 2049]|nr:hypothetical protein GGI11_001173 [Coemansia sp. RSA 2049]
MPPRKARKAAATQLSAASKEKKTAEMASAGTPPVTPTRRSLRKSDKAEEAPPPDTVGMTRRTRRASAENIPQPSPATAKQRKSPRKAAKKPAAPKAKARAAAPRSRRKTTATGAAADQDEYSLDNHPLSTMSGEDLDSADEAFLETPTRRHKSAGTSFVLPNDTATESENVFIEIVKETPDGKQTKQPGRRGRKRKSVVEADDLIPSADYDALDTQINDSPLAGRGSKRLRSADPSNSLVLEEPSTPTRTTRQQRRGDQTLGGEYVDIVSPSKFERSRARIAAPRLAKEASKTFQSSDPEKWREKYNELFSLRFTKAEGDYDDFRKSAEERFQAADALIDSLRKEIGDLKIQAKRKQDTTDTSAADKVEEMATELQQRSANEKELEIQVTQLTQTVETLKHELLVKDETIEQLEQHRKLTETSTDYNLREKFKMVQEVTGFGVEDVVAEDEGVSYVCKQSGSNSSASYVLTVFDDMPNEYQYTPYGETTLLNSLPEYFKEPMSFERSSANMFFWRMCDHLHHDIHGAKVTPPSATRSETNEKHESVVVDSSLSKQMPAIGHERGSATESIPEKTTVTTTKETSETTATTTTTASTPLALQS